MNINPFSLTPPNYDSYDDFYKFFEVPPKEVKETIPIEVFPPAEPTQVEKQEKRVETEQDTKKEPQ